MGSCNNCGLPNNSDRTQFVTSSGCFGEFTSENFNEGLARGRLSKAEVDEVLERWRNGPYKPIKRKICCIVCIYLICLFSWMAVFLTLTIANSSGREDMVRYYDSEADQWYYQGTDFGVLGVEEGDLPEEDRHEQF